MFLSREEIKKIGFRRVGKNVSISDKAVFYGADKILIGDNTRIDDFCLLSAGKEIRIGDYVHISCFSVLLGHDLIELADFSGLSMRCVVLSTTDDYSGEWLTNPQVPERYRSPKHAPVVMSKHSLAGVGSIIMPGVSFGLGAIAGAGSFVKHSIPEMQIWGGNPLRFIKERKEDIKYLEKQLRHG